MSLVAISNHKQDLPKTSDVTEVVTAIINKNVPPPGVEAKAPTVPPHGSMCAKFPAYTAYRRDGIQDIDAVYNAIFERQSSAWHSKIVVHLE